MIDYERGLYVVIEQLAKGPAPFRWTMGSAQERRIAYWGSTTPPSPANVG